MYIYIIYIYISAKKWRLFEIGHTVAGKFQAPAKIAEVMPRAPPVSGGRVPPELRPWQRQDRGWYGGSNCTLCGSQKLAKKQQLISIYR